MKRDSRIETTRSNKLEGVFVVELFIVVRLHGVFVVVLFIVVRLYGVFVIACRSHSLSVSLSLR